MKSISSLDIFSLSPASTAAAESPEASTLGRLLGLSPAPEPAALGSISFNFFFKSLYDKNLSRHSGKVSSIWLLRLFPNFISLSIYIYLQM
ncbi:hypothetical protein PanWU01x14_305740 [Parasponia andersonii]|uniref:Uncharacterized protein n=1 Tax=Parasponia andersonii TaxID=3476 RepID=A0A2P5ARZ7_PARAD|nr:hypothetical protein PanWU01x14_305740 [Parasponia andersonii]